MRRREFFKTAAALAVMWPCAAGAQQPRLPVVGFLRSTSAADSEHIVTAFRQGLREAGFIEGQNVVIEFRWANNQIDRLPALVKELVDRGVGVIAANTPSALSAKATTSVVPIVFATGGDPVREGLVTSLNAPGGNVTGVSYLFSEVSGKRLDLLRQLVPKATTIGLLVNLAIPNTVSERGDILAAAKALGQDVLVLDVGNEREFEQAFATFRRHGAGALYFGSGGFLNSQREQLVALAARYALPASYVWREAALAGGLMSYGPSIAEGHRQLGIYAGRILKGEKPSELPVMQSTKIDFVLNLKTARALGLEIPPTLLALADEVIE